MTTTSVAILRTDATRSEPASRRSSVRTADAAYASAATAAKGLIFAHECHHGFCTVCGSVWPCSRAARTTARQSPPIPRSAALSS
jgi:hypothetical protein